MMSVRGHANNSHFEMNTLDVKSFNRLFTEYYSKFLRFALGYVHDIEIAEDFVSEAFTTYWENYNILTDHGNPQAYILTAIKNKCLNHLKHLQVRQRAFQQINQYSESRLSISISLLRECDPEFLFSKEIQDIMKDTLNRLPHKTREIFNLSREKGLGHKEIADIMGLSTKAVEFHISKALKALRLSLRDFITLLPILAYLL